MPPDVHRDEIPNLIQRLQRGDRSALSRLLTLAANSQQRDALATELHPQSKSMPPVIALTGGGGVGKSSLLGALTTHFAQRGERVGVLACDPESPVTGGALLGDRCRIAGTAASDRVFVRSLSTVSGYQGVAPNIDLMLDVMKAFGFDRIFVETVGAGQGDIAIRQVADIVVLILQPQTGDELQWEKAGILELADLVVVNKGDLAGADRTLAEVRQQIGLADGRGVSVIKTSIASGEGIEELCLAIEQLAATSRKATDTLG